MDQGLERTTSGQDGQIWTGTGDQKLEKENGQLTNEVLTAQRAKRKQLMTRRNENVPLTTAH